MLLGPTASGKESAAVQAACRLGAEIVAADSVKPYRGLAVAAAAPPPEHVALVPHHVVGVLEPSERLHAARWVSLAESAFADIRSRGRRPLVVGGTALYLKALLFGLFEGPARDDRLREELSALEDADPGTLHRELSEVDPEAAERIHPHDRKRLLRALEVQRATGEPISSVQRQWTAPPSRPYIAVGLRRERDDLRARIDARVERMVAAGLLEEVHALVSADALGPTAREAIGVKELVPLLRDEIAGAERDPVAVAAGLERVRGNTRVLARKQMTWWRKFPGVRWLEVPPDESAETTGTRVADELEAGLSSWADDNPGGPPLA